MIFSGRCRWSAAWMLMAMSAMRVWMASSAPLRGSSCTPHSVSLVRLEVVVSVLGEPLTEPLTFVQQVHLRPKVEVVLRRGRASKLDHPLDVWPHPAQGFEPLRAVVLEARRLVQHHHVKRPPPAVVLGQPDQAISVGYVDVGLFTKGTLSLLCGAQHGARA